MSRIWAPIVYRGNRRHIHASCCVTVEYKSKTSPTRLATRLEAGLNQLPPGKYRILIDGPEEV